VLFTVQLSMAQSAPQDLRRRSPKQQTNRQSRPHATVAAAKKTLAASCNASSTSHKKDKVKHFLHANDDQYGFALP
jgi:hypothetical protein